MSPAPLRVAVLGAGTVGRQVVRGIMEHGDRLAAAAGRPIVLAGVAVRDIEAARQRGLPGDQLTDAPAHLVATRDSDLIVEVIGGEEPAGTLVAAALSAGKSVVTANKHLLAHHGADLEAIARSHDAALRFEAAVGGGIPVLGPMVADLAANRIDAVRGIVNGTTNYILTAMADGAGTYEAVLRDAQERGYAEADPSGDVEGRDAVNKLVVLGRLAFDRWLDPDTVPTRPSSVRGTGGPGITGVTALDLDGARALGLTIRLMASLARRSGPDAADGLLGSVVPAAVPLASAMGATTGVRNRIELTGDPIGTVGFDGPGAGGEATASAVLGDIVAIARGAGSTWEGRPQAAADRRAGQDGGAAADAGQASARWFTHLAGVRAGQVVRELAEEAVDTGAGVAVRTPWMPLDSLRSRLGEAAPDTLDAQIYAIDD